MACMSITVLSSVNVVRCGYKSANEGDLPGPFWILLCKVLFYMSLCHVLSLFPLLSVYSLLSSLLVLLWVLVLASLFTVVERKVLAAAHRRKGPTYLGYWGMLQIVADGVKLLYKDWNLLGASSSSSSVSVWANMTTAFAPLWMFVFSYMCFGVLMMDILFMVEFPYMFLFLFALSGLAHMGILLTGMLTDSKWTNLGAVRGCIVFISYDVLMLLCWLLLLPEGLCSTMMSTGTFSSILDSQSSLLTLNVVRNPLLFLLMFFTILVELGRVPTDLSEAESELVSGYNVEYGGFLYAMMASSEYASMTLGACMLSLLFFGTANWLSFVTGVVLMFVMFICVRATVPRLRYTDVLKLYWCDLMPLWLLFLSVYILV
jgi:NADH:ubiquinone oxidoreductase subunit H